MEYGPVEDHFGEGLAKPVRLAKKLGRLALRLLNPYYPQATLGGEPTPREKLHQFFEEARKEEDAHKFDMGDDLFMRRYHRPDGSETVFTSEGYKRHLDEINGLTDGLEGSDE